MAGIDNCDYRNTTTQTYTAAPYRCSPPSPTLTQARARSRHLVWHETLHFSGHR
eukprot:GDKH01029135.1.p2 GENE.GDKH01029135.1~~GDKH01029135.1.p2  ORF type:complete len:54 (-),score=2.76 GDKH01029135.1:226-387(-)